MMIYINQVGQCELSRGRTVTEAVQKCQECGFDINIIELKTRDETKMEGDVYWTSEKHEDYN